VLLRKRSCPRPTIIDLKTLEPRVLSEVISEDFAYDDELIDASAARIGIGVSRAGDEDERNTALSREPTSASLRSVTNPDEQASWTPLGFLLGLNG
jgi:hypothetical protein